MFPANRKPRLKWPRPTNQKIPAPHPPQPAAQKTKPRNRTRIEPPLRVPHSSSPPAKVSSVSFKVSLQRNDPVLLASQHFTHRSWPSSRGAPFTTKDLSSISTNRPT